VQDALRKAEFERASAIGRAIPPDEAIACALGER
jgi:hypothetical protein